MSPSPQRIKWVTEPEEIEPRPEAFSIERKDNTFTIMDPEGKVIRRRASIIAEILKQYPDVSEEALKDAQISYFDYSVIVEL